MPTSNMGFVGAYGAKGASDALQEILARRALEAYQQREYEFKLAQEAEKRRQFDVNAGLNRDKFGLDRDEFGFRKTQWDEGAAGRAAGVAHTEADTARMTQQTGFDKEDRQRLDTAINQLGAQAPDTQLSPVLAANLKRGGIDFMTAPAQSMLFSPAAAGQRAGEQTLGAWNAGGRTVAEDQAKIQGDQQVRVASARQAASGGGAPSAAELDNVAKMVIDNPDRLKDFTPTDRGKILTHIANSGQSGELQNLKREKATQMRADVIEALNDLSVTPGMEAAIGAPSGSDPGSWTRLLGREPMAGSAAASFTAKLNRVKSLLTLPKLEVLKGLGAMSDIEFGTMQKAATALDSVQTEEDFVREFGRLDTAFGANSAAKGGWYRGSGGGSAPAAPRDTGGAPAARSTLGGGEGGGMVTMRAPTGQTKDVPASEAAQWEAKGATRMATMQAPNGQTKIVPEAEVGYWEAKGATRIK